MTRDTDVALRGCGWFRPGELEDLLEGRLREDRREAFLRHTEECPECGLLLDDVREWEGAITKGPSAAEESLFRRHAGPPPGTRFRGVAGRLGLLAAAACLACALLLVPRPGGSAGIVGKFAPPAFLPPPVTRGQASHVDWRRAEVAWREGRYRLAAAILEEACRQEPVDREAAFQAGLARLMAGQSRRALRLLEMACESGNGPRTDPCAWWLAVARDRVGDREGTCRALEEARRLGGRHAGEAERLFRAGCQGLVTGSGASGDGSPSSTR